MVGSIAASMPASLQRAVANFNNSAFGSAVSVDGALGANMEFAAGFMNSMPDAYEPGTLRDFLAKNAIKDRFDKELALAGLEGTGQTAAKLTDEQMAQMKRAFKIALRHPLQTQFFGLAADIRLRRAGIPINRRDRNPLVHPWLQPEKLLEFSALGIVSPASAGNFADAMAWSASQNISALDDVNNHVESFEMLGLKIASLGMLGIGIVINSLQLQGNATDALFFSLWALFGIYVVAHRVARIWEYKTLFDSPVRKTREIQDVHMRLSKQYEEAAKRLDRQYIYSDQD